MANPLQFAYRTQKAIGVFDAAPVYEALPGFVKPEGTLRCCVYSPCGRFFAYATNDGVNITDASVGHVLSILPLTTVYELAFSPRGSFLSTWERPAKDDGGDATKNFKVWRTVEELAPGAEKLPLGMFVQKSQSGWNLQYTADERFCARLVTNEVQFYQSHDLSSVWNKLRVEGVSEFAIAPGQNQNVAVFVPERKVSPCSHYLLLCDTLFRDILANLSYHHIGSTCGRQGLQRTAVHQPHLSEDLLQGGQGST
jgi:translation initiation factor 2A